MKISRRLIVLLAVPLAVITVIVVYFQVHAAFVERETRFVAETQIESLATLQQISRAYAERSIGLRSCLLSNDPDECAAARAVFSANADGLHDLFERYEQGLVTGGEDARLFREVRELNGAWSAQADALLAEVQRGERDEAIQKLFKEIIPAGDRLREALQEWTTLNARLANDAGEQLLRAQARSRRWMLAVGAAALLLTAALGAVVIRAIVRPLNALRESVEPISSVPEAKGTSRE